MCSNWLHPSYNSRRPQYSRCSALALLVNIGEIVIFVTVGPGLQMSLIFGRVCLRWPPSDVRVVCESVCFSGY